MLSAPADPQITSAPAVPKVIWPGGAAVTVQVRTVCITADDALGAWVESPR